MMVQIVVAISLLLFGGYAALIIYYGISWRKIPLLQSVTFDIEPSACQPFITIIIPARISEIAVTILAGRIKRRKPVNVDT